MKWQDFCKKDKDSYVFNLDNQEMVYFIPEEYFIMGVAQIVGDYIETLGVFNYTIYEEENKSKIGLKNILYPSKFQCKPSTIEKVKQIRLLKESEPTDYRVLTFKKGDKCIINDNTISSITNVVDFMRVLSSGKLPNTIPVSDIWKLIVKNSNINNIRYPVNIGIIGMIARELTVDKDDEKTLFMTKKDRGEYGYRFISITDKPRTTSPFTAMISEDFNKSIIYAMNNNRSKYSPLERSIIKGSSITYK